MKRIGNLFPQLLDINLINFADTCARKGKHNFGIYKHDKHKEEDNLKLLKSFKEGTFTTSKYETFKIYEPKERIIFRLPYYPDRIAQWSLMLILEPIWEKIFIANTYSCIKGRGIHKLVKDLKKVLEKDQKYTKYCLKMDIKKFYPSINHDVLKNIIRKKIKDRQILNILDNVIDSTEGVPIGNYLSQFFANLYLSYFDHWIKEEVGTKYYFRYADDIIILSNNKQFLHNILIAIKYYLNLNLKLSLKNNYQIFPIEKRGIDFVGYVFKSSHILLRKRIKNRLKKLIFKYKNNKINFEKLQRGLIAYFGWLKYCNSKHLLFNIDKLINLHYSNWNGKKVNISKFYNKNIRIIEIIPHNKYYCINFVYKNKSYTLSSSSKKQFKILNYYKFPTNVKLIKHKYKLKVNNQYECTQKNNNKYKA